VETDSLYRLRQFTQPPNQVMDITIIQEALEAEIAFKNLDKPRSEDVKPPGRGRGRPTGSGSDKGKRKSQPDDSSTKAKSAKKQYEEICAADPCTLPYGKIDWVQCEFGCQLWFHFVCVGLKKGEVAKIQAYCCKNCEGNRKDVVKEGSSSIQLEEVDGSAPAVNTGRDSSPLL